MLPLTQEVKVGRQSRFHVEQIVKILREQETSGLPVSSFLRRYGVSRETFYRWRRKYGGLSESEATRLKRLERENARLKMLVADRDLEVEVLREVVRKKS
jgi:putative transposase